MTRFLFCTAKFLYGVKVKYIQGLHAEFISFRPYLTSLNKFIEQLQILLSIPGDC